MNMCSGKLIINLDRYRTHRHRLYCGTYPLCSQPGGKYNGTVRRRAASVLIDASVHFCIFD